MVALSGSLTNFTRFSNVDFLVFYHFSTVFLFLFFLMSLIKRSLNPCSDPSLLQFFALHILSYVRETSFKSLEPVLVTWYNWTVLIALVVQLFENDVWAVSLTLQQFQYCHAESLPRGSYEKARLRFAHAETVVPFSCLLGLFLEGSGENSFSLDQTVSGPVLFRCKL